VEGSCERGDEPPGSIKSWKVLEWVHNWQLLKRGSAPCVIGTHRPRYIIRKAIRPQYTQEVLGREKEAERERKYRRGVDESEKYRGK
jgi:hypothetical protein